jgi:hypothetical protein
MGVIPLTDRPQPDPDPDDIGNTDDAIRLCAAHKAALTAWERGFIESLAAQSRGTLFEKQTAVLVRLVEKCKRYRGGGRP